MRHIAKTCLAAVVAGTVAFGAVSVAAASEIKVGSFVSEQGFGSRFVIAPWIERATKSLQEIGSDTTIKAYWGGTLGKSPFQQYDLVKVGVADIAWVLPANTPGQFPEIEIVELPFFFRSAEEASVVGWKLFEMGLFSGFEDTHIVGFFSGEPASIFSKDPVKTLADLKNKKIRSVWQTQATWLTSIGAIPEAASSSEMNEKLNRGTLSGAILAAEVEGLDVNISGEPDGPKQPLSSLLGSFDYPRDAEQDARTGWSLEAEIEAEPITFVPTP